MGEKGIKAIADWRDPEQYPPSGASAEQWAWEFLRRNPDYQTHYNNLITEFSKRTERMTREEVEAEWEVFRFEKLDDLVKRWGIFPPTNPESKNPPDFIGHDFKIITHPEIRRGRPEMEAPQGFRSRPTDKFQVELELHQMLIRFDLRRPQEEQIKIARRFFSRYKKDQVDNSSKQGFNTRALLKYLRLLDADAEGSRPKDFQGIIYSESLNQSNPPDLDISGDLKKAHDYRDEGYKAIFAKPTEY